MPETWNNAVRLRASQEKQLQVNFVSIRAARINKSNYRQKTGGNGRSAFCVSLSVPSVVPHSDVTI